MSPTGFDKNFGNAMQNHLNNRTLGSFDKLYNKLANRHTLAPKEYRKGIKRRAAADVELAQPARGRYIDVNKAPIEKDIYYRKWRSSLPKNLQQETPTYNLRGAYEAGVQPELSDDGFYHLPTRNPETGEYFKSAVHPTVLKGLMEDMKLGYTPTMINGHLGTEKDPFIEKFER